MELFASYITIFIFILVITLIGTILVLILRKKYILFFNKSFLSDVNQDLEVLKVKLAEKERILDLYHSLSQNGGAQHIKSILESQLKPLVNCTKILLFLRIKGTENLELVKEKTEGEPVLTNFKQHPYNDVLKNNKIVTFGLDQVPNYTSWMPEEFDICKSVPTYQKQKFLGITYLFFKDLSASEKITSNITGFLHAAMELAWYDINYSNKDLMENILAETGRLNKKTEDLVEVGSMTLNRSRSEVLFNGNNIDVTNQEFNILELLVTNKGRFITTEEFLNQGWNKENVSPSAVDIALFRLRQKFSKYKDGAKLIKNSRGKGYTLNIA